MLFQTASALWWWLPLTGIVLLLYLLKMRRRDVRVPAAFLWPQFTSDVRANAPIQRLRVSLLLLVQLLILTLLVFAAANPLRKTTGLHGKATVIVLDSSASMSATDVRPSRFEAARSRIASIIATMSGSDQLALIEAGPVTRVIFPLTGDKAKMTAALRGLRPTDSPNDLSEALRLAAALTGQRDAGRIVVLSDGAFPPVKDFSAGKAEILYESFGESGHNLAVTALEAAQTAQGIQLFAGIRNYDSQSRKATITFYVDGKVTDSRSLTVPSRQTLGQTLAIAPNSRRAEVRLASDGDILKADNSAALFLQGAGTLRVLLVTPGNLFLERAIALEPNARLDRAASLPEYERAGTPGEGRYDVVVFDGVAPLPVKAPAVWSFGGISSDLPVIEAGAAPSHPHILTWKRDHPLLRHADDLDALLIEKGHKVRVKPEGQVLAEGRDGPLLVVSETGGRRAIYAAWSLLDSDFPLRVSFPIFVSNALAWLSGGERAASGGLTVRAGQPFSIAVPENGVHSLTLEKSNGERAALDAPNGFAIARGADVVGDYAITGGKTRIEFVANLLNEEESDVAPRSSLELSGHTVGARGSTVVLAEIWRPLVLLALALLSLEWWIFARRS